MKLITWKVYLGILVLLFLLAAFTLPTYGLTTIWFFLVDLVLFALLCVGVYSFVFRKLLLTPLFWKYFFWINIIYSIITFLYASAPHDQYLKYLSFLNYTHDKDLFSSMVISTLLSIPAFYAVYKIAQGQTYQPKTKADEKKEIGMPWGMGQTALWGYSLVFVILIFILSFAPSTSSGGGSTENADMLQTTTIFAPILLFWLWVVWEYKRYRWNWWRITLVLNAVLFSSLIVFGGLFTDPQSIDSKNANMDFVGILQFLIIIAALIVFGRDKFARKATL